MMASSSPSGRASPHAPPSIYFPAVGAVGAVGPIFSGRRRKSGPDPDRRWAQREASRGLAAGGRGRASNRAAAEGQGAGCRPSLLHWRRPPLLLWRACGGFEQAAVTRIWPLARISCDGTGFARGRCSWRGSWFTGFILKRRCQHCFLSVKCRIALWRHGGLGCCLCR
ncbi:unnamed protein product, partial [Urochloa humidicola]